MRRSTAIRVSLVLLALPVLLLVLFVLNGTVLCDGTRPRCGTVGTPVSESVREDGELRLMAFNLAKCFVRSGRFGFAERATVTRRLDAIAGIIRAADPDIICLSEVLRECGPCDVDQVRFLAEKTGFAYWTFGECSSFGLPFYRTVSGNAILSRYPLRPLANVSLAGRKPFYVTRNSRRALACSADTPYGELMVWSVHNDSFNLSNNLVQVRQLLDHTLSRDAFMAGDFNAEPDDASICAMRDCGRFAGVFRGPKTFPVDAPCRTIDYVFAPDSWVIREHRVITNAVSDHCAVLTAFSPKERVCDGPWQMRTYWEHTAVAQVVYDQSQELAQGGLSKGDVVPLLRDERTLFVDDGGVAVTVRDLAYTMLEEAGMAELPVSSTRSKLICGCEADGEWYRFHIPELTDRDFEVVIAAARRL